MRLHTGIEQSTHSIPTDSTSTNSKLESDTLSSHGSHASGNKKLLKAIGITFRHALDIVATAILFYFLWREGMNGELEVRGVTYHSGNVFANSFYSTVEAMARGFASVTVALWHMSLKETLYAIVGNLFSWDTFVFAKDTAIVGFITFCAYALYRSWWLGGTVLLLGGLTLGWMLASWGLQLLGPLVLPLPVAMACVALVIAGGIWGFKKLWAMAEDKEH